MWQLFGLEIIRFSILVLSALILFGLFWLYFDAWRLRKNKRDIPLLIGLLLLSFSFLIQGVSLETRIFASVWSINYVLFRAMAYLFMIIGLLFTPIEERPQLNALLGIGLVSVSLQFSLPVLCAVVALLFWRRSSIGLEEHMKKVSIGFGLLSLYELLSLSQLFRSSQTVWIARLAMPFGIISLIQYGVLILAVGLLARWTWYYLLKRLSTQLFMIMLSGAVGLSLLITGFFITLLLKNVEAESLQKLTSNAQVVASLIEEKKANLISEAKLFALDSTVLTAIATGERKALMPHIKTFMKQTGVASVVVTGAEGTVLVRGENEEERGTSLSDDYQVKKALTGDSTAGFVVTSGVLSPEVSLRVVVPAGKGTIGISHKLDTAYIDGLKARTGMVVTVFGDKIIAATTLTSEEGKSRLIGLKETDPEIIESVWRKGAVMAQPAKIGDGDYLAGYVPLKDTSQLPVAVLQVAEPQSTTLRTASLAVQYTFGLVISIIIILSFPLYLVCERLVAEWE